MSPVNIVKRALDIIEEKLSRLEYNYVRRLLYDGLKRDIIFIRGITIGVKLIGMPKTKVNKLIKLLEEGIERENSNKAAFSESDLKEIDELLKGTFNLATRRRIINVLRSADAILLRNLIDSIKKSVE